MSKPVLLVLCAACSAKTPTATTSPAEVMAVPLTAATQAIATSTAVHEDLQPPWSLTASDGSGLQLVRVDARAVFEGPLAFTELHLYFHNGEHRRREGTFQITLPEHAAVSRFAMQNDGQWMEAEVVEKQLARRAYDDFLHRKQDPALLEKGEGNQFTAKVFPIAPDADKQIVISYSQDLAGTQYALPLRGLPKIGQVDVALAITGPDGKQTTQRLDEKNWQPDHDFVSTLPAGAAAVTDGHVVAAQLAVFDGPAATESEAPSAMTVLVDTSASRGLGYERYVHAIHELVGALATRYPGVTVQVIAFDQDSEPIFAGRASEWGAPQDQKLIDRGAAGASDLGQALATIGSARRVVIVTDGVVTAGDDRAALTARVGALAAERVDVVLAGGIRDSDLAGALVHTKRPGAVLDLDAGAGEVATALGQPVMTDVAVEVPGAIWSYPHAIASARPGTSAMIYAQLAHPASTMDVVIGGKHRTLPLVAATGPLVERAVAAAGIDELEQQLAIAKPEAATALRAEIAKRSVAARVVSSQTSLLVLESDDDYARYGIDRRALADVLVVGPGGLELHHRAAPALIAEPVRTATKTEPPKKKAQLAVADKAADNDDSDGETEALVAGKQIALPAGAATELGLDEGKPESGAAGSGTVVNEVAAADEVVNDTPAPAAAPVTAIPPADPRPGYVGTRHTRAAPQEHENGDVIAQAQISQQDSPAMHVPDPARAPWPPADKPPTLTGELATIEAALARHDVDGALAKARDWHAKQPGDVLALIGLGDALEAKGSAVTAARVYGSIIDLFPARADMRRFAAERLARLTRRLPGAQALVVDSLRRAAADRPDHLTGRRLYAYALLRAGKPADAFAAILQAIDQPYRTDSYAGSQRVLADDAGMLGAAYIAADPAHRKDVEDALAKRHLELATKPSTRFILYWETDGNDVDFHIQDARGNHAWYSHKQLASGGELYADITTGYGPECFAIPGTPEAGPYRLSIDYYSQGPMGYGMGLVEIQRFDGKGKLSFEDRPYVIMNDHAYVDLGTWKP
ncbi:MAG TPA: VIT domain-containing protein [Kofleriaceae bacterium]|nr:VIT domain-containing protein [Kofleriaceae bacterium]